MDPISDLIVRIKAAILRKKETLDLPGSKVKKAIAELLKEEGFLANVEELSKGNKKILRLRLKYARNKFNKITRSAIGEMKRISKPGCRIYKRADDIHRQDSGFSTLIISTSKGMKTDDQVRKERLGGEVLLKIS